MTYLIRIKLFNILVRIYFFENFYNIISKKILSFQQNCKLF